MKRFTQKLAALAIVLAGAGAHADNFYARVQRELNSGKDYSAAWAAASRAIAAEDSRQEVQAARQREAALRTGKDYAASWDAGRAGSRFTPEEIARARRQLDALNEGKDYAAARSAGSH